jgi:hypothetical protein
MLYYALVRPELEYASVAWNSVTITDSNKLERSQRKFVALCHNTVDESVSGKMMAGKYLENLTTSSKLLKALQF